MTINTFTETEIEQIRAIAESAGKLAQFNRLYDRYNHESEVDNRDRNYATILAHRNQNLR